MKIYICFVFCVLAISVRDSESLKILKKIRDYLHPSQATTTSPTTVTILPTYSGGEDHAGEDGRPSTTPWSEVGVGGVGSSDLFTTVSTPSNEYYNNENENEHKPPSTSSTSQSLKPLDKFETKESINVWLSTEKSVFSNNDEIPQSSNNINNQNENNDDNTLSNSREQKYPYQPNNDRNYTQDLPYTVTTIESVHNSDDYVTEAATKQPKDINTGDAVSNNNYNQQQPMNSNNQQELTNNERDQNSNNGYEHSTIPENEHQPPLDPNKQQPHTTNRPNHVQPSTSEKTSSNQKNNEVSTQTQGKIPLDEDGLIVFPTDADSGPSLEPTRKDIKDDGHKGSSYAESTTGRTAKAPVPVGDGGRVAIDAPRKDCPAGSQLDEGECRKIS